MDPILAASREPVPRRPAERGHGHHREPPGGSGLERGRRRDRSGRPRGAIAAEQAAIEVADTHDGDGHGKQHLGDPEMPVNTHLFFAIYFCMTGLHGIHVVIGMGVIGWLIWRAQRASSGRSISRPVDLGGLYWHIVDLIWIFLFPLFYLIH